MRNSVTYAIIDNEIRRPGSDLISETLLEFMREEFIEGGNTHVDMAECLRINDHCHMHGYFDPRRYEKIRHELQRLAERFKRTDKVRLVLHLHRIGALE